MFTKEEIRKNRDRYKQTMKDCMVTVKKISNFTIENKIEKDDHSYDDKIRKRKVSQDYRIHNQFNSLKESYISYGFNDEFDLGEKIGQGTQSVVYQCREKGCEDLYAVKLIRSSELEIINTLKEQYRVLKSLEHSSIIKAHYLFINEKESTSHMVCQYIPYPSLRSYLKEKGRLKESEAAGIINSILNVLSYMHQKGVAHRDLKPENIMYDPQKQTLKIIDFEIAKMRKYEHERLEMWTKTGTLHYKAPQMFNGGYNEEVDIWAVGIIAYQMIVGKLPFRSQYAKDTIDLIQKNQPIFTPQSQTSLCQDFIMKCLNKNPLHRLNSRQALRTPFILKYCGTSSTNTPKMKKIGSFCKDSIIEKDDSFENDFKYYDENTKLSLCCKNDKQIGIRNSTE